ncbi:MAG: NUDIX domain-containing protein [Candidatus Micrarchaeia archaeon]
MKHAIAVKAFIVDSNRVLLIKRNQDDEHCPGLWEIPGGRLEEGENPFDGLKREVREETGLETRVGAPLQVHHFTRDDGQSITMIVFACSLEGGVLACGGEHSQCEWVPLETCRKKLSKYFHGAVDEFEKRN